MVKKYCSKVLSVALGGARKLMLGMIIGFQGIQCFGLLLAKRENHRLFFQILLFLKPRLGMSRSWKNIFLSMDIEVITTIPIGVTRFDNFWAWHRERTGIF
jgi:hypothetical protein